MAEPAPPPFPSSPRRKAPQGTRRMVPLDNGGGPSRPLTVFTNCYRVSLDPRGPLEFFHYDVKITPSRPTLEYTSASAPAPPSSSSSSSSAAEPPPSSKSSTSTPPTDRTAPRPIPKSRVRVIIGEMLQQRARELGLGGVRVIHDGRSGLFAPRRLQGCDQRTIPAVTVVLEGRRQTFDVTVRLVEVVPRALLERYAFDHHQEVNVKPVLQVLELALRNLMAQRLVVLGRNFFSLTHAKPLGTSGLKDICEGYHQVVRTGEQSLVLNMDTTAGVFYARQPLLRLACMIARVHAPEELTRDRANPSWRQVLRRLQIVTIHRPQDKHTIQAVESVDAVRGMLFDQGGTATESVQAYFFRRYCIRLRYPQLPVIAVGKSKLLPMELCEVVPGQRCRDLDGADAAGVIKVCAVDPARRHRTIDQRRREAGFENDPFLYEFGVSVSSGMESTTARIMKPPTLGVGNSVVQVQRGTWSMQNMGFYRPRRLSCWAVLNLSPESPHNVDNFVRQFEREARRCGLEIVPQSWVVSHSHKSKHRPEEVEAMMKDLCQRASERHRGCWLQLFLVIKGTQDGGYRDVKRVSDSVLGIPSQCILSRHVSRTNGRYLANLSLKVNLKLNGLNFVIDQPLKMMESGSTIVFGAMIEYPRTPNQPAIAAVVASMEAPAVQYIGRVTAQSTRDLDAADRLPQMLCELFGVFYQQHGACPQHIVFFRDGVSDGGLDEHCEADMGALTRAWSLFTSDRVRFPGVTLIATDRHHHIRAFPRWSQDADKSGNVPPGTVIDDCIVDPRRVDFFLFGHRGILGTSRPAHYTVLVNDNKWSLQEIEQLCFDLCHTMGRAFCSTSVVAPVYYAKLLAARGRLLLSYRSHEGRSPDASSTDSDTTSDQGSGGYGCPVVDIHRNLLNTMFYV